MTLLIHIVSLFNALSTLGSLGAGFTLSVVVADSAYPSTSGFDPATVNTWAAVSSILFVLTVLVSQGFSQIFQFEAITIAKGIEEEEAWIMKPLLALSLLLQAEVIAAFLCLELVVTAYSPRVGLTGVALTSLLAFIALVLWISQALGRRPVAWQVP